MAGERHGHGMLCVNPPLAYLGAAVVLLLPATRVARRDERSRSVLGANWRVLDIVTAAIGIARLLRGDSAQKASILAQYTI
jgi:hypothetical protein